MHFRMYSVKFGSHLFTRRISHFISAIDPIGLSVPTIASAPSVATLTNLLIGA